MQISESKRRVAGGLAAILIALASTALAAGTPAGPDPEALAVLKKMTDYVGGLERFSLRGQGALEVVLDSGQKLQFDHDVALLAERPGSILATRVGELTDQALYVDGGTLTLHSRGPEGNYFATAKVPATLDGAFDFLRDELDLVLPAADLLYSDAYASLTGDMTAGFIVSREARLAGKTCTHLAFRKPGIDLQVWIANGDQPLPLKLVLTTTDMMASPQFVITLSDWNTDPRVDAGTFGFTPPADARRIDFVRKGDAAGSGK